MELCPEPAAGYTPTVAKVRGSALITRITFVKERWGDEGWKRLQAALSPLTKQVVDWKLDLRSWQPFEAFVDLNSRIDSLFGKGDYRLCYEMGAYGANRNMNTVYRLFIRLGSLSYVMGKAASLWSEHYDAGKLVTAVDEHVITLRIEEFPSPHCTHCFSVMGWAAKCGELTGARLGDTQRTACRNWRNPACVMAVRMT